MAEKKEKPEAPAKKANTALDSVLAQIRKEFGELSIMKLGDTAHADIPVISTAASVAWAAMETVGVNA